MSDNIDITPSARVLRMLGEIDFKAWQCLCELIDNSIDSFSEINGYHSDENPQISIALPNRKNISEGVLVIKDNGQGMTLSDLEKSLRAGFSGNDPVEKMGLFGMGFNISTARLGGKTELRTTTKESEFWLKVTIDFQNIESQNKFLVPIEQISKQENEVGVQGTIVSITKLRDDHVKPLFRKANIRKKLGKIYGRIITQKNIQILYGGDHCKPFKHCVWSNHRSVTHKGKNVYAIKEINVDLDTKRYCTKCWVWLTAHDSVCPSCSDGTALQQRTRKVVGWIGIQRYFDKNHYGIDLIRNGRVIEELDKSFFSCVDADDMPELEYPIDGYETKGRIVGELEIDFVRVTHQKDAFEKTSRDWKDVVRTVRGEGPIRPEIGKQRGFPVNDSPLATLFSAYRRVNKAGRSTLIPGKVGGGSIFTSEILNDFLQKFNEGQTDYQDDSKWWELVDRVDRGDNPTSSPQEPNDPSGGDPFISDPSGGDPFVDRPDDDFSQHPIDDDPEIIPEVALDKDLELSSLYELDLFPSVVIKVECLINNASDHSPGFEVEMRGANMKFTYWSNSKIFKTSLLKPADYLINELAYHFFLNASSELSRTPLSLVELKIREKYFPGLHPDFAEITKQINQFYDDIRSHLGVSLPNLSNFDVTLLSENHIEKVKNQLAEFHSYNASQTQEILNAGKFPQYASNDLIKEIVRIFPSTVFDESFFIPKWSDNEAESVSKSLLEDTLLALSEIDWFLQNRNYNSSPLWQAKVKRVIGTLDLLSGWRA